MHNDDIIVIGGGINGVSTAFHLAKAGAKVTLLEKDFIAAGPTGYSSAIIRQHYSNDVTAHMALKSLRVWQNFDDAVGGDCGYTKTGFLIAVQPQDIDGLKANIIFQQSFGINTQFVSSQDMREMVPHLDTTGLGGGAYEPDGGYCDPAAAANALAEATKRLGGKIRIDLAVEAIQTEGGHITGVQTPDGFISAEAVVLAAGPWSATFLNHLGVAVPITPARVKIALFQRPEGFSRHPVWADFIVQAYMRSETGGHMLVGSISPDDEPPD